MSALGVEKYRDKHETALLLIDLKNIKTIKHYLVFNAITSEVTN